MRDLLDVEKAPVGLKADLPESGQVLEFLADKTLLQVTSGGEPIIAGGAGSGYRLAELMSATDPSRWAGVLKVKTPAGTTLGYVLLFSNP